MFGLAGPYKFNFFLAFEDLTEKTNKKYFNTFSWGLDFMLK